MRGQPRCQRGKLIAETNGHAMVKSAGGMKETEMEERRKRSKRRRKRSRSSGRNKRSRDSRSSSGTESAFGAGVGRRAEKLVFIIHGSAAADGHAAPCLMWLLWRIWCTATPCCMQLSSGTPSLQVPLPQPQPLFASASASATA